MSVVMCTAFSKTTLVWDALKQIAGSFKTMLFDLRASSAFHAGWKPCRCRHPRKPRPLAEIHGDELGWNAR